YHTNSPVNLLSHIFRSILLCSMIKSSEALLISLLSDNPEKLEKLSTLARELGIKVPALIDWLNRYPDDLPALRLPGSLRVRRKDLVAFLRKINNGEIA